MLSNSVQVNPCILRQWHTEEADEAFALGILPVQANMCCSHNHGFCEAQDLWKHKQNRGIFDRLKETKS